MVSAGIPTEAGEMAEKVLFEETVRLVEEVKEFGKTLGIEPTEALRPTVPPKSPTSMLWLWAQKAGTVAMSEPIDIAIGLKFSTPKEQLPLDGFYKAGGYSIYYRQGNQFGDPQAAVTPDFASESPFTKVMVTLHEDLHDAKNFDLPWEVEESLVTPLGALAALAFFEHKGDPASVLQARSAIKEGCAVSGDLNALAAEAARIFNRQPLDRARGGVLQSIASYPAYDAVFRFQLVGQDPLSALEAKISHDLAYYKYFERVIRLYDRLGDLNGLIRDLKQASRPGMDGKAFVESLGELELGYASRSAVANLPAREPLCS
jgi:hypothetical protein